MTSTKEPTPAETLRDAATRLRELAAGATPGPWQVSTEGSEGSYIGIGYGDIRTRPRFVGIANGSVQPQDGRNARWIATLNPTVAEPLAAWLEEESVVGSVSRTRALAFAHLILRTETPR